MRDLKIPVMSHAWPLVRETYDIPPRVSHAYGSRSAVLLSFAIPFSVNEASRVSSMTG